MEQKRPRGRPALPKEEKRVNRGIKLLPATWERLRDLARAHDLPENRLIEKLIAEAADLP